MDFTVQNVVWHLENDGNMAHRCHDRVGLKVRIKLGSGNDLYLNKKSVYLRK